MDDGKELETQRPEHPQVSDGCTMMLNGKPVEVKVVPTISIKALVELLKAQLSAFKASRK